MASYQVTCHTPDNADLDRRLQGLGGPNWWYTIDNIIRFIEQRQHTFWVVSIYGQRVDVVVRQHPNGRKYLTTTADGFPPNNLLNLRHCPR